MIPFRVDDEGLVTARFTADEATVLRDLADQLITMLADRSAEAGPVDAVLAQAGIGGSEHAPLDPALARLLPDAYRDDPAAASEHRRLTERGLIDRKVANAQAVVASLRSSTRTVPVRLDAAGVQSWLRTLGDLRLTIAARLDIVADGDPGRVDGEDDAALLAVYEWLGAVQGLLVEAIDARA